MFSHMDESPRKTLGVAQDADLETCRKAWKKQVRANHPDRTRSEIEKRIFAKKLIAINAAWENIKNGNATVDTKDPWPFPGKPT